MPPPTCTVDLTGADLSGADLRHAELTNADFGGPVTFASLSVANLSGIRAFETNFTHAFLDGADLSSAELGGAKFTRAYLRDANLSGADLGDAKLDEADLKNADLTGATLTHASFMRAENLDPQMVKKATYWEYAFYDGPTLRALGLPADHNEKLQQYIQEQKETSH